MKSQHPFHSRTDPSPDWRARQLPIGLTITCIKGSFDIAPYLDLALPEFDNKGMVLTFLNYKGDLQIAPGRRSPGQMEGRREPAHPGLGLLSLAGQPLRFHSAGPIQFFAIALFI